MDRSPVSRRRRQVLQGAGAATALGALGFPAIVRSQSDAIRFGHLTPRENLNFALKMHSQTGDVDAALKRVDLSRAAERRVRFLSAGMKKRLALTRLALLARPLVLVDEPFANLDTEGRELAIQLLAEAQAAGSTLIVAAHEPELSLRVAPRALVLDGGVLGEQ